MISRTALLLNIGREALTTHRLRTDIAGQNIANVSTKNYARERVDLSEVSIHGLGRGGGVTASSLSSARQIMLDRLVEGSVGQQASADQSHELAAMGELALQAESGPTLSTALADFYASLRNASAAPEGMAERQDVLSRANTLATTIADSAKGLDDARNSADVRIADSVAQANQLVKQIATLNSEIAGLEGVGMAANEQRNARARMVESLSEHLGVKVAEASDGQLRVSLESGPTLVEGDNFHLLSAQADASNANHLTVSVTTTTGVHSVDAQVGGRVGGALAQRDGSLLQLESNLDQFSFDLAGMLNTMHNPGVGLDGLAGRNLFDTSATVDGAALALTLSADVDGQPRALGFAADPTVTPGDNSVLLSLISSADSALSGGQNASQSLASMLGQAGAAVRESESNFDAASSRMSQAVGLRESSQGVSLDEELISQMEAQRAFDAASKLIKTADEMFATVLSLKS